MTHGTHDAKPHLRPALGAAITILMLVVAPRAWGYTAATVQDLGNFYDAYLSTASGIDTINGQTIDWTTNPDGTKTIFLGAGYLGNQQLWAANDKNGMVQALANALGIPPEEIYISSKDTSGASQATTATVFTDLVMPKPTTAVQEKKAAAAAGRPGVPRTVAAAVRYSYVDTPADNGYMAGLNLGLAWDFDRVSTGFLIPYDYTDLDGLLTAKRLGAVWFGQYGMDVSDTVSTRYTVYLDYSDTVIDYDAGGDNHLATHGGGVGVSLSWQAAGLSNTIGASVQEHRDNSPGDRTFDTFKLGMASSLRIGATQVAGVNVAWTNDFSDYDAAYEDDNMYEAGLTYRNDLSDTWCLNIGINRVFKYNGIAVTEAYLGSATTF